MRRIAFVAIVALAASPAAGQRVELMSFVSHPMPASAAEAGSLPAPDSASASLSHGPATEAMISDFTALGNAPTIEVPALAATLPIPLWLQTGVTRSGNGLGATTPPTMAPTISGCSEMPYRVRSDLAPSTEARRLRLYPLINQAACEAGIPTGLFDALVSQESRYNLAALSPKGAMGLTQLMPGTARALGVQDPWRPYENLRGGARYLRQQLDEFGRVDLALAAYNAGPGRVRGKGRIPPIAETIGYVSAVTRAWSASLVRMPTLIAVAAPPVPPSVRPRGRVAELVAYTFPSVSNPM